MPEWNPTPIPIFIAWDRNTTIQTPIQPIEHQLFSATTLLGIVSGCCSNIFLECVDLFHFNTSKVSQANGALRYAWNLSNGICESEFLETDYCTITFHWIPSFSIFSKKSSQLHEAIGMNKPHANKVWDHFGLCWMPWVTDQAPDNAPKQADNLERTLFCFFYRLSSAQDVLVQLAATIQA